MTDETQGNWARRVYETKKRWMQRHLGDVVVLPVLQATAVYSAIRYSREFL